MSIFYIKFAISRVFFIFNVLCHALIRVFSGSQFRLPGRMPGFFGITQVSGKTKVWGCEATFFIFEASKAKTSIRLFSSVVSFSILYTGK